MEGFIFGVVLWGTLGIWFCAATLGRIEKILRRIALRKENEQHD